jgi:L-ascorbate metabolism protein UlaG (beta-lactamase superfamily)
LADLHDGHVKIIRMGHAAVVIEAADTRLLIDPGVLSEDATFELEGLDGIVVTHQHPDHLDRERLAPLLERNASATLLCDPETADLLGPGDWTAHSHDDETFVGGLTVLGVGAQHAEIVPAVPRIANTGVLVSADGEPTLFHPGDSYEHAPGGVDVLALPLSAPWTKVAETVEFVQRVSPTTLFPIHDAGLSEFGHGLYWGHVANFGGVEDARRLGPAESTVA